MRRFGSYKQLLSLILIQSVLANSIAIIGIALTIAGFPNIFGAPEFSGPFPLTSGRTFSAMLSY